MRGYAAADMAAAAMTTAAEYQVLRRRMLPPPCGAGPLEQVLDEVVENGRVELVDDLLPVPLREDEARVAQHGQVPRDGRPRRREALGDLAGGLRAVAEQAQDLTTGGVAEGAEGVGH